VIDLYRLATLADPTDAWRQMREEPVVQGLLDARTTRRPRPDYPLGNTPIAPPGHFGGHHPDLARRK
jgi:hypothetical protein